MTNSNISVVIPCYNHGSFLKENLEVLTPLMSKFNLEVIVVNDGSTDEYTLKVLEEVANSSILLINQENKGLAAARNCGINKSTGEFIIPLDADNILLEHYVTEGLKEFHNNNNNNLGVVYSNVEYFGAKSGIWKAPDFDLFKLIKSNYIDACAIFRKSCWESISGYDEHMPFMGWEDWDFWMRLAIKGIQFKHIDKVGFKYRVRPDSMISTTKLHQDELREYIFSKEEYAPVRGFWEIIKENEKLRLKANSRDYELGRAILNPLRKIKKIFQ